jgi:hypothetical protein
MENTQFESSTLHAQRKVRITCKTPIAEVLLEDLRAGRWSNNTGNFTVEDTLPKDDLAVELA